MIRKWESRSFDTNGGKGEDLKLLGGEKVAGWGCYCNTDLPDSGWEAITDDCILSILHFNLCVMGLVHHLPTPRIALSVRPSITEKYRIVYCQCIVYSQCTMRVSLGLSA